MSGGLGAPEAALWALLDRLGVPFRHPAGALAASHGTQVSVWNDRFRDCVLPGIPLVPGASAFSFQWNEDCDPTLPPAAIGAHVRTSQFLLADIAGDRRAERNLAAILRVICPALGQGVASGAVNTRARIWHPGQARIVAQTFPPRLDRAIGENRRHMLDPGSRHEAVISIHPGWLPDLNPAQLGWLAGYELLGQPPAPRDGSHFAPERWHRWPIEAGPLPQSGYGPSLDGGGFCAVAGERILAIPRENLREVVLDVITPARGCGGVDLLLLHAPAGIGLRVPHRIVLSRALYAPDALHHQAAALARALDLPLTEKSGPDD